MEAKAHIAADVIRLKEEAGDPEAEIATLERWIDETNYRLHGLKPEGMSMVEGVGRLVGDTP